MTVPDTQPTDRVEQWLLDAPPLREPAGRSTRRRVRVGLVVLVSLLVSVAFGFGFRLAGLSEANTLLVFLVGVALVAFLAGRAASIVAAVLAVLAFNFFFTHPLHTFAVAELEYFFTFAVLLATGLAISELVTRLREKASHARAQAEVSHALYRVGGTLTSTTGSQAVAEAACREIERWLGMDARLYLATEEGGGPRRLVEATSPPGAGGKDPERALAEQALRTGKPTGCGTEVHPESPSCCIPLPGSGARALGVLAVTPRGRALSHRERTLLASLAGQIALALEREAHGVAAQRAAFVAESERLRANLLATVSHDLRTPLAAISGASSTLIDRGDTLDEVERRELLEEVLSEAERLSRMVENLLQLGRIDDGRLALKKEWYPLDEVAGAALARLGRSTDTARIALNLPPDLPLVPIHADLVVNLFQNLLENALRYAPTGAITVDVRAAEDAVEVDVTDEGPGLPEGDPERLFERFTRGDHGAPRGTGLGLAICRAIVHAHGGSIRAERVPGGGARFHFDLPLDGGLDLGADSPEPLAAAAATSDDAGDARMTSEDAR